MTKTKMTNNINPQHIDAGSHFADKMSCIVTGTDVAVWEY
jgi:hypothetical protein